MKIFEHHIRSATQIVYQYDGQIPLAAWLKNYFKQHKKYGSKDRKSISQLCYSYFRLGQALKEISIEEKIVIALFLCSTTNNEILQHLKPAWNHLASSSLEEKCGILNINYSTLTIFPFLHQVSNNIDINAFNLSHLQQPNVFIRIRPGHKETVIEKMAAANISYSILANDCMAIPSTTKIDELLLINKEVVIQDYSSQRVGSILTQYIKPLFLTATSSLNVWDCCAASGGKSIMAKDILNNINLTVSDIRPSILINLKERFKQAGIYQYHSFLTDLAAPSPQKNQYLPQIIKNFNLVIADVPCSGSGTWGRTPEQISLFKEVQIDNYSALQKKIISNIIPFMEKTAYFLYITCSVFKKENEDMALFISESFKLELVKMEIIKGYGIKADTMFAALFIKK